MVRTYPRNDDNTHTQLAVMVNGLPGAMGKEVAAAVLRRYVNVCVLYVCVGGGGGEGIEI
jgi:hypothetical protein